MRDDSFRDFVLEELQGIGGVRAKAMFGGFGLYRGEAFFGIIHGGALYLRTDSASRIEYERRGMRPFTPSPKQRLKAYYEVPADVLEDAETLADWACRALAVKPA